ncbi:MAG: 16S rRNA (guanine(527)-N(7))-methyltransferase RsmG [candidate division Zixibacteria bacterium]|nr:16S rRNA (guanine(527)-N(7))-methyltransferase RsmG [candidate division Zixibacteria bacterium]
MISEFHDLNAIISWCDSNGLYFNEQQLRLFDRYISLVRERSRKINLVSSRDQGLLVERHLLDSLNALVNIEIATGSLCADLGSGAGFPGIPIAIARPDIYMDLFESRRLKSLFLATVVEKLQLANVTVVHGRWENQATRYDYIFARAVYNEKDLREIALPRLNPRGFLIYYEKYMKVKIIKSR